MPNITIEPGETRRIVNQLEANLIADPESDETHAIVDVSGAGVRITEGKGRDYADEGFPVSAGTTITGFLPSGQEIYAFGDGDVASEVHVHLVGSDSFDIVEVSL